MIENIKVSVFLVVFNEEKYIRQALDSILSQKTDFAFEIICHDDASSDGTQSIILEYSKKYNNIKPILQNENQCQKGVNITLEFMYKHAKGKYIAYCDGDDYWTDPYKLQKQYDFLEKHQEYVMCLHNFSYLIESEKNAIVASKCGKKEKDLSSEEMIMWSSRIPQIGTALFRKTIAMNRPILYQKIGGSSSSKRAISDHPLYIYMSFVGKVHYFPNVMSIWRQRITGSWGSETNTSKTIFFYYDLLDFFGKLDEDTHFKYRKTISKKTNQLKFSIAYLQKDYRKAFALSMGIKIPLKSRIVCFIGCFSGKLANKIRNVK